MTDAADAASVFKLLQAGGRAEVSGWTLTDGGDLIWLTNPYGLDVGFYDHTSAMCERILAIIAADDHDREWGML